MVDLGHDINIQDEENGDTPLHAARYDQETYDVLVTLGADRTLRNWNDRKPKRPSMWVSKQVDAYGDC